MSYTIGYKERNMSLSRTTPLPLSVENEELNIHHRLLFELFDKVEEAITDDHVAEVVSTALVQLRDYASYHFGAEEALFEVKSYPGAEAHAEHHLEFRAHLSKLMALQEKGDGTVRLQLLRFLRNWFQDHIMLRDKAYIPYLRDETPRKVG
jgi:hemerythrin